MRRLVLYLVPDLVGPPGGIARYCQMVSRALLEAGVCLEVLSLRDQPAAACESAVLFPGMAYRPCAGSRFQFVRQSLTQAVQHWPKLIIVGHPHFAALGWALARLTGARAAALLYGLEVWKPLPHFRCRALQRMDSLIAISQYTARRAAEANAFPADKIRILYSCLDPQFAAQLPLNRTRRGPPGLLTVARLSLAEQYKGHDYVLRALPPLLAHFPDLIYHIVGEGDWRPALEALAEQLGVGQAVRFHGRISDDELQQCYREASVFIMPSRAEGFGFVFVEAMAHGLPAIGGNLDATPEVIVDGETGYLIDPTSVEAIVNAVSTLLGDEVLRQRLGEQAARHVRERFGYARFQQQLLAYLGESMPALQPSPPN